MYTAHCKKIEMHHKYSYIFIYITSINSDPCVYISLFSSYCMHASPVLSSAFVVAAQLTCMCQVEFQQPITFKFFSGRASFFFRYGQFSVLFPAIIDLSKTVRVEKSNIRPIKRLFLCIFFTVCPVFRYFG